MYEHSSSSEDEAIEQERTKIQHDQLQKAYIKKPQDKFKTSMMVEEQKGKKSCSNKKITEQQKKNQKTNDTNHLLNSQEESQKGKTTKDSLSFMKSTDSTNISNSLSFENKTAQELQFQILIKDLTRQQITYEKYFRLCQIIFNDSQKLKWMNKHAKLANPCIIDGKRADQRPCRLIQALTETICCYFEAVDSQDEDLINEEMNQIKEILLSYEKQEKGKEKYESLKEQLVNSYMQKLEEAQDVLNKLIYFKSKKNFMSTSETKQQAKSPPKQTNTNPKKKQKSIQKTNLHKFMDYQKPQTELSKLDEKRNNIAKNNLFLLTQ